MVRQLLAGLHLLQIVPLILGASGFFLFWRRTRFWFPRYAHILAAIALGVGVSVVCNVPPDAPISRAGVGAKVLLALAMPIVVYVYFVVHGGQAAAYRNKAKTAAEMAGIIDRFLNRATLYPQEWNDFVECKHPDRTLECYRKRCDELDPLVNRPDPQDAKALAELGRMVEELRRLPAND